MDPQDRHRINEERAEIITGLRRRLGHRFKGGFVPDVYARQEYPSLLSELPVDQRSYLDLIRRCDVGISAIGLHRSNPFKIAEYLAASRPIVSEPLAFSVPVPLEAGRNVRWFDRPEACIETVEELLDSPDLLRSMREANAIYWRDHGHPAAVMRQRLAELT